MNRKSPQLVFGDDGSPAADVVWLWINNHPWPGWRISVVTAQPPPNGPPVAHERSTLHPWEPPSPRQLFAADDDTQVEHLMAEADPRIVLDSCKDAALVAVGPRGLGVLKRLLLGSTTEWLVSAHRPLAPLVLVRSAHRTRQVLLCVDGSVHAQEAARSLARLPWIDDCDITVLGVRGGHADPDRGVEEAAAVLHAAGVRLVGRRLTDSVGQTATFDVRSTILDTIADINPDLVAMGTRGQGGIRRVVLGSTASAVVHHAPCSVLIVRAHDREIDSGAAHSLHEPATPSITAGGPS